MEGLKEAKEGIEIIKKFYGDSLFSKNAGKVTKAVEVLIDLAEQVVALSGKMPAKRIRTYISRGGVTLKKESDISLAQADSFNEALDLCTKAFVGMLGDKKDTKPSTYSFSDDIRRHRAEGHNELRAEILKKMGGE